MNKSFFLKRGFEIKLRESKQFVEISVGVSGEIDPETGMIINLSVLDQWFKTFSSEVEKNKFSDLLGLLEIAENYFKQKHQNIFAIQIDCQQATALPFSLRRQYEENYLALNGSLLNGENFQISFLIKTAEELEILLARYLKNQNQFSSADQALENFKQENNFKVSALKIRNPILNRSFVKSLD